ncbi:hypothetical protein VNI00_015024 [Paramarasmius palmivorus]|uniref:Uncharacterized protein n=1 Tax=Paramarasmius palmivorus TaxID=297713 RepID=A0AAW0BPH8_9AGAR
MDQTPFFLDLLSCTFGFYISGISTFFFNAACRIIGVKTRAMSFDTTRHCQVPDCTLPIDIVLCASNGKQFGTHKRSLEMFNEGFPPSEIVAPEPDGKPSQVSLSDGPEPLQLLLQFSHNAEQPDLRSKSIHSIMAFSIVAEKYGNMLAIQACRMAMEDLGRRSPSDALVVVSYKVHNCNYDGIDEFARRSMGLPLKDAVAKTREYPNVYAIWTQYREEWQRSFRFYSVAVQNMSSIHNGDPLRPRKYDDDSIIIKVLRAELESDVVPTIESVRRTLDRALRVDGLVSTEGRQGLITAQRIIEEIIMDFPVWTQFSA